MQENENKEAWYDQDSLVIESDDYEPLPDEEEEDAFEQARREHESDELKAIINKYEPR